MKEKIIIRKYKKKDRAKVREIACDTAFMGECAEIFFEGREFLADSITLYFTDYEPGSCFVAELEGKVIGYLIGSKNEKKMNFIFLFKIAPRLFIRSFSSKVIFSKKNWKFIAESVKSFFKGELGSPDFPEKDYPALLHINIEKNYRNYGIGNMLMDAYLIYLKNEKITGVHLTTQSENAFKFFERSGFVPIYETKRSYFKYILNRKVRFIYYGKKIS
ncbi:MAG: GNAT family N-acetyltransferase [Actinobacteria bacterium]|nr:GNAT family N-acetyltransferase [Actinomycetota bacterium]